MKRRDFIKTAGLVGAGLFLPGTIRRSTAAPAAGGLSDPALQPKFANPVPDALAPGFKFYPHGKNKYDISIGPSVQKTGLIDPGSGKKLNTRIFGYGDQSGGYTWPGKTFEVKSHQPIEVKWRNKLTNEPHLVPVDTSLHWAYSLHGYERYSIERDGIPIVVHLHGGHTKFQYDGNPEFFFSPGYKVRGPQWVDKKYIYDNDQPAGNLWYHDHALGITRLNVYAGLAGFYFIRDDDDTGLPGNPLNLPAWPYEKAYAIQDRMFYDNGELFYPAFPGDPFYDDFITDEDANLPPDIFPDGGPTALAEFFGDHMVVNGVIWPYEEVEPRNYRLHLLNGTDSRFMAIQLYEVPAGAKNFSNAVKQLDFTVIGSDQGLASAPKSVDTLVFEPGARYDIVVDFKAVTPGNRVIMKNIGGDEPFGGDIPGPQNFGDTDKVMAFDVVLPFDSSVPDNTPTGIKFGPDVGSSTRTRKVALFEGKDEFGRLQPLLGTAEPATDYAGNPINWPNEPAYVSAGLVGQMEGAIPWHSPTTENPALNSTEKWEIWNMTGDAHPIHLHLVHFKVLGRKMIKWDSATNEDDRVIAPGSGITPAGDGTYMVPQPVVQHNGQVGEGFKIVNLTTTGGYISQPAGYVENTAKDMVTALPDQVTYIKAKFDKPGRYVWHCHILSHEDHEMMRVLYVGAGALGKDLADRSDTAAPESYALDRNTPNPFNPSTQIGFRLPRSEHVELKIYNSLGQEIRTLVNRQYAAGAHTVMWNGTNEFGQQVASGTYFYKIQAGSFTRSMKMQLLK